MANTYKKPETCVVKVETQQILQTSNIPMGEGTKDPSLGDARGFDFFSFEEEEEAPGKSDDDDDWEDWEEEE